MMSSGRDSYRPHYYDRTPRMPPDVANTMYNFGKDRDRQKHNFSFRSRPGPKPASQRKLLTVKPTAEHSVLGNHHGKDKYKNVEDLTDSDEAEMEASSDEAEDGQRSKRIKLTQEEVPKWSNPDPYTSLPPPTEHSGKRTDFVKLIRKARNETTDPSDIAANQDDFISFGEIDDDTDAGVPMNAPTGPKADRPARTHASQTLGKRKREIDENRLMGRHGRQFHADGMVLSTWRKREDVDATPWLEPCISHDPPIVALHKETIDFYHWVRPQDYEFDVRGAVVNRISRTLNRMEPGELKSFGSYAAGLYLPTGDMDLVYMTRKKYGPWDMNIPPSKPVLYAFRNFIDRQKLARPGTSQVIPSAKVPIIKFIEAESGLKVDLSFNNDSGVIAIETFNKWKKAYPSMPIIVSIIKQYLMIRGLNDVSVGGLGGFSTICLVTSIIQHLPQGKPLNLGEVLLEFFNVYGNLFDRERVGIRLDPPCYIEKHKYRSLATNNEKADRLTIMDPNRSDNNVSGGSHEIARIFRCFSSAHHILEQRLSEYKTDDDPAQRFSFLEDLVGGNFSAYETQREVLKSLQQGKATYRAPAVVPPPPPPVDQDPIPPPPPPARASRPRQPKISNHEEETASTTSSTGDTSNRPPKDRSKRRLERIKKCRPDLIKLLGNRNTISIADALKFGKWKNGRVMEQALMKAEKELGV